MQSQCVRVRACARVCVRACAYVQLRECVRVCVRACAYVQLRACVRDPALQITVRMVPCTDYEPDPEAVRKMRVHKEVPHPPRPLSRPVAHFTRSVRSLSASTIGECPSVNARR